MLNTLTKDLENVFFDKFYEFIGFDERITKSYSIVQFRIELQRMRRLTDDARATTEIPKSWDINFRDNRDFEAIVNFEPAAATKKFHELATCGRRPGVSVIRKWQYAMLTRARHTGSFAGKSMRSCKSFSPPDHRYQNRRTRR